MLDSAAPAVQFRNSDLEAELRHHGIIGLFDQSMHLPPWLMYDKVGTELFKRITELDEYYVSRAEEENIARKAQEIARSIPGIGPIQFVELGCGCHSKTLKLVEALKATGREVIVYFIDISTSALRTMQEMVTRNFDGITVHTIEGTYENGLHRLPARPSGSARLFAFLGSSIGNMTDEEAVHFLGLIRSRMTRMDRLLVGFDLNKSHKRDGAKMLHQAYSDSQGVTAKFNRNVLARLNQESGCTFDVDGWEHLAYFDETRGAMVSYLVATRAQTVTLLWGKVSLTIKKEERIFMEQSRKPHRKEVRNLGERAGLSIAQFFTNRKYVFANVLFAHV